jgi:hypothetical protein
MSIKYIAPGIYSTTTPSFMLKNGKWKHVETINCQAILDPNDLTEIAIKRVQFLDVYRLTHFTRGECVVVYTPDFIAPVESGQACVSSGVGLQSIKYRNHVRVARVQESELDLDAP